MPEPANKSQEYDWSSADPLTNANDRDADCLDAMLFIKVSAMFKATQTCAIGATDCCDAWLHVFLALLSMHCMHALMCKLALHNSVQEQSSIMAVLSSLAW